MANEAIKDQILDALRRSGGLVIADDEVDLCAKMKINCTRTAFKRALGSLRFKTRRVLLVRKYVVRKTPKPDYRQCTLMLIA